jgi:twinkle protein
MSGDITDIKRALAQRAQAVAEMLLPRGRKEGSEWRVGSLVGEPGQSLGVHLTGNKAGLWKDFSQDGEHGDLIDLWQKTTGLSLVEVLDRAREYLGMETPTAYRDFGTPKKTFKLPSKPKCHPPKGKALDYLREVRNLSSEVIEEYKIGEDDKGNIIFPFLDGDQLVMAKRREPKDGAKPIPTAAECQPTLMGWHTVQDNDRVVYLTEGEIDAPSLRQYGFRPSLSLPFGGGTGGKQAWIEHDFEKMQRFEKIYLVLDDDKVGDEAAEDIAKRLGRHRCVRVRLPKKDANECLMAGVVFSEIETAVDNAEGLDPVGLRPPTQYGEALELLFYPINNQPVGYYCPYTSLGLDLLFRPGELTLWSGSAGSGKSQIISDCCVDWVKQGSRVCVASFEMHPKYTLKRMVKQAGNVDRPTREYLSKILGWLDQGVLLYERVGKQSIDALLEIFDYARAKYGCDQFVIDSFMRLGIDSDDYAAQEKALFKIVTWAVDNEVHVHLVAHSRKGERSSNVPEIEDVKGAMEVGANAFNIITVWRNRKQEDELQAEKDEEERKRIKSESPGVIMNVCKQRNGDWEGKVRLHFSMETYRYSCTPEGDRMRNYQIDEAQKSAAA